VEFAIVQRSGRRGRAALRWTWVALVWALLSFGTGLAACTALPSAFGLRTMTVLSGSMEPTLDVGGVVIDQVMRPTDARVGDIVTFPEPGNRKRLITHRLRHITVKGPKAYMVTKGDANDTVERWNVPVNQDIGRVAYHLPKIGYTREWATSRLVRLALPASLVLLLLWVLADIWLPSRQGAAPPQDGLTDTDTRGGTRKGRRDVPAQE
jgi:signal peptidase